MADLTWTCPSWCTSVHDRKDLHEGDGDHHYGPEQTTVIEYTERLDDPPMTVAVYCSQFEVPHQRREAPVVCLNFDGTGIDLLPDEARRIAHMLLDQAAKITGVVHEAG